MDHLDGRNTNILPTAVEVVGFIGRILSTNDLWALGPFIMQSLLLLLAPALFAATVYMILGRIILLTDGEPYSLIRQKWLTKIFVTGDVISFLTQMCGGGIQAAGTLALLHAGEKIVVVGLFLQLAFFGFFIVVAGLFHYRLSRVSGPDSSSAYPPRPSHRASKLSISRRTLIQRSRISDESHNVDVKNLPWKRHMYVLYTASALIMIRSIFRVIEYLQGNNGYLLRREIFLYIFDALLMFVVMVLFNAIHPAKIMELYRERVSGLQLEELEETRQRYLEGRDGERKAGGR